MDAEDAPPRIVYLMRGLPSTGKSHTARVLAGEHGVVCETDEFFYTEVGEDPTRYDYDRARLPEAREWNLARYARALDAGRSPIVVDRGNGLSESTAVYARRAHAHGYSIELREPDSEWWQEIRVLLKYRHLVRPALAQWADVLARMNASTHRVSAASIYRRMQRWRHDVTVEEILAFRADAPAARDADEAGARAGDAAPVRALRPAGGTADPTAGNGQWGRQWVLREGASDARPPAGAIEWDA